MKRTKGRGVDVILNSLAGVLFDASVRCLAVGGRFLEIGKIEFLNRKLLDSFMFLKNCSFHGIFLDNLFSETERIKENLHTLVANGISDRSTINNYLS